MNKTMTETMTNIHYGGEQDDDRIEARDNKIFYFRNLLNHGRDL